MRDRSEVSNILIFWIFVLALFVVWFGEAPIIAFIIDVEITDESSPFKLLLVIIIVNVSLLIIKKDCLIFKKILNVCQTTLLIYVLIEYFFITTFMVFAMILLTISLLEMMNLFLKSSKTYKYGSNIIYCLSFLCLVTFWLLNNNLSRFEYHLNDDESYSILDVKSNIHTIRIPSTYKGKPVVGITDWGMGYYSKENIKVVIFEENSNIKGYYLPLSNLKRIKLPRSVNSLSGEAFHTKKLKEIIIPIEVNRISKDTFDCENAIIYCEAESKPVGWDKNWCYKAKEIIWGYKG